jgi:hypothetical protein
MVFLHLKGGLGNQLFQFGAALRASNFNLDLIRIIPSEDLSFQSKLEKLFSNNLIPEITSLSHFKNFLEHQEVLNIEDSGSPFLDTPILDHLSNENNYFLNGYFQSSSNALAIRKLFHDPKNSSFSEIHNDSKVCIHHRYGDYAKIDVQRELGLIDLAYYDRIFNLEFLHGRNITALSDSDFFLNIYRNNKTINDFLVGGDDIRDFNIMRSSEMLIIPNSSFSLMAAYLNTNLKLLIRPSIWSRRWQIDELTKRTPFRTHYIYNSFINLNFEFAT